MIAEDLGIKLENVTLQMLGRTKRVRIEKDWEEGDIVVNRVNSPPQLGKSVPFPSSKSRLYSKRT